MIRFESVYKRYPNGRDALASVSFRLEQGEMAFLTGPSGAGKSTLLKLVALIERPSRGTVLVGSLNTSRVPRRKIPEFRRRLGIVFQDHKLLNDRTVFDNVALPLVIGALRRREIGRRVRAALDQVGLLGFEKNFPESLSSGEQQRVGIARAVASRPELVIADEPTGNLDTENTLAITKLLLSLSTAYGKTVVLVSHDLTVVEQFPSISTMRDGHFE